MGTLSLLPACRASYFLTPAAARCNGFIPRPPRSPGAGGVRVPVILAVLVTVAAIFIPSTAADQVRLKLRTSDWHHTQLYVFTNSYDALDVTDLTEGSNWKWERGVGYTNFWFQETQWTYGFGTNDPPTGPGSVNNRYTNTVTAPWTGDGLGPGTAVDSHLFREHWWVDGVWIENHVLDQAVDPPDTNFNVSLTLAGPDGMWPMSSMSWLGTGGGMVDLQIVSDYSEAELVTSGTNASALFCLTGSVRDWSLGLPFGIPLTSGWTIASNAPDTNGRVFLILGNGTTNDVTVKLDDSLTNSVTNWNYSVGVHRVQLTGLLWWNPTSSNWSSGPLFVMSNSTVTFTITANLENVAWPTNLPVWNCEGRTQNGGTTFTHTFTNVSSSADMPFVITATAGNAKSNSIVVYSVEATMTPDDNFSGRSTNEFGVCEILNFGLMVTPADLPASEIGVIDWQFSAADTNAAFSWAYSNATSGSVILFGPSTPTTIHTSVGIGDNIQLPRYFTWASPFILPNNLVCEPTTIAYGPYGPGVWHTNTTGSCGKMLLFNLVPANVSFREIHIREGTSTNEFGTGVCPPPAPHSPSANWATVNAGDATNGCLVNLVDQASTGPWGVNQPRTFFAPNGSTNGSTRGYDIWIEYKGLNEGEDKARKLFTVPWRVTISSNGRTEIKKDSMTPIAREWDDPYSNY